MTGLEPLLMKLGSAVVKPAATAFLTGRRRAAERSEPLAELVNRRVSDDFLRRRANRELEALIDAVAQHLGPLCATELPDLPDHERLAALDAVAGTFAAADLTDDAFFAADADPVKLSRQVRAAVPDVPGRAGLSEPAVRYYDGVLDEVCVCFAQLVVHLGSFTPRAEVELLRRMSGLADQVAALYTRLPTRTLDAPTGTALDDEFRDRYLRHISATLDQVELFGVDVRHYRPRTTLSVAYISLAVTGDTAAPAGSRRDRRPGWEPGRLRHDGRDAPGGMAPVRVEHALGPRTLIRGEAGSGKSTLLRWLAVTAARGHFDADLKPWNGLIPFLIKLRSHAGGRLPAPEHYLDGVAGDIAALMPEGWVHRQLDAGRALVMVDGVDELPTAERREVRAWLRRLTAAWPKAVVVVTSRPAAAAERWLSGEGFTSATLERMSPADVRALVRHWHEAIRDAGDLPCDARELPAYEAALLARLDSTGTLQALATSPLLCAMLCALNLDRNRQLPTDRMGIFQAAVDLLLDRRDAERQIPATAIGLDGREKLQLLQHLAWRMTINGRTEIDRTEATRRLGDRLRSMPRHAALDPSTVLDHLLARSGILGEPVMDRLEFVHRTFQDYLTARECAEQNDVGVLVDHAHRDTWRETVVLAAGHGNRPFRTALVTGLLDRADTEPTRSRALRLVAATCLETVPDLEPPPLLARLTTALDTLVPPRRPAEARSLSAVGDPLLRALPTDLSGVTETQAAACVRAAALVNGPKALEVLARYAPDPRRLVQQELVDCWDFFGVDEYADAVLLDAPLVRGNIVLTDPATVTAAHRLCHLTGTLVDFEQPVDLATLLTLPGLWHATLRGGIVGRTVTPLAEVASLTELSLGGLDHEVAGFETLGQLESLSINGPFRLSRIDFVRELTALTKLDLSGAVSELRDFSPLSSLGDLNRLRLDGAEHLDDLDVFEGLTSLRTLYMDSAPLAGRLTELAGYLPALSALSVQDWPGLTDLQGVARFAGLSELWIGSTPVSDLGPLAGLSQLTTLRMGDCQHVRDLTPLTACPKLELVSLWGVEGRFDLRPFAGRRLRFDVEKGAEVVGGELLAPGSKIHFY